MSTLEIFHFLFDGGMLLATVAIALASRRPQQNQVSMNPTYASKEDFTRHEALDRSEHLQMQANIQALQVAGGGTSATALMNQFRSVLDERISELQTADNRGRQDIHNRINEVEGQLKTLIGQFSEFRRNHD